MTDSTHRKAIIDALLSLLETGPLERIGLNDIAKAAGISLADLRGEFSSVVAILAAHMKDIDRTVLSADTSDMGDEPARERLFDVLMRRLDAHAGHKVAIRSLIRSTLCNPPLALVMNGLAARSMSWMMTAAGISAAGPKGALRAQALTLMYVRVLSVWANDEDPGLARTMAALDRELARAERWSGFLDTMLAIPERLQAGRWRARRRRDPDSDDGIEAA
ncbi:TetR/AcrR family transcriptional regulator [Pseudorhodoplanes sp.]|uniref:TetR/AcrR family transcriptional regulator n=1 Tax=Pseudorhodoplanes sp. TaxID=1934341 RepID=UPI002BDD169F|nr:TetR/AcrR family transcriptional regulator [Pseudorhodoplanes sp.]HWV51915.1 TetR/AcrR family transcriptional regulator [Pseudorhodoplanes sp.]